MANYTLSSRDIPLDDSYEVIVAGGGPAGCAAAAASGRGGAKTLLIEATGSLGGMGTSGLVPAWCPFTDSERIIYSGLAARVLKECIAGMPHVADDWYNWTPIDPELLKRIYDDLVSGFGVDINFNTLVSAVESTEGEVNTLIVSDKSGLRALQAKIVIDCTGDADIAAWAGADYEKGDDEGTMQPATHCFMLSNVDDYAFRTMEWLHSGNPTSPIYDIRKSGKFPLIPDHHICNTVIGPGCVGFNAGHVWDVDNTRPVTVSRALIEGRKMAEQYRQALAEYAPKAFANAFLANTASLMGIRETRRIIGDYFLTIDDLTSFRSFDDEISRNCYYVDIHHRKKEVGTDKEGHSTAFHFPKGKSHGIPYRCLLPQKLKNVLIAGRSISTDRSTQGSTRVMPVCLSTGEAAGTAAAEAIKNVTDLRSINIRNVRNVMRNEGAYLPEIDN